MRDNRPSQNSTPPVPPEDLDLVHLNRSLELANLELDRVQRQQREFLANTAHELRTLNAILSFLRLVMDGLCDSPEEARQFVHNAYDSARSLLDLVNEHLDSAEIEADKLDLQLTEVNVAAVFDQVEKLARRQADRKKVHLAFRTPRTRVLVRADPIKLSQVLLSLVSNAIRSTAQGEVQVQARSWRDQGHVRFEVRILGCSPEKQGHLFHHVAPTSESADSHHGETASGLTECKTLVECMGGQIWLSPPSQGQGASAFFTLPLVTPKPLYWRRTADRERGLEIQGPASGPLVLLVEDEPKVLDKLARILQKHGYRTAYAVTADDGLEGAQRLEPAVITIDLGLPVRPLGVLQNGMDLYQALQSDPHLAAIPAILVTGHDPALTQATWTPPPVLSKPFRAHQLLDLVADQLRGINLLGAQGQGVC